MNLVVFFLLISILFVGVFLFFVFFGVFSVSFLDWFFVVLKVNFCLGSFFFSLVLFLVVISVIIFSSYYMDGELNLVYFFVVFVVFVLSMFFLNFSYGIFFVLLSWDVLGVSSFFLVLFYNNWDSCSGAMNTVMTNRVGDFFLFVFFCVFVYNSLGFFLLVVFFSVFGFYLVLAGFTKSAQFPFSGWLPKAMSAPTPVSALVHSSTLVTAGLILLMGFEVLMMGVGFCSVVFMGGLLTMCFSSVLALVEDDMKKVVALSTLSQMGFSMMTLGVGLYFVSLLHLVSHALFKSCLFMQVGVFIHSNYGQQDVRGYSSLGSGMMFVQVQMLVTLFCLCGLFFTSGLVTKDVILEFFFVGVWSLWLSLLFFGGVFMTFCYCYRLFSGVFVVGVKSVFVGYESVLMGCFSLLLVFLSLFGLWWLVYNMVCVPVLFLYLDGLVPLSYVFVFLVVVGVVFFLFMLEFKYKFLCDYDAKEFGFFVFFDKFYDVFIGSGLFNFFCLLKFFGAWLLNVMLMGGLNMLVVVLFVFFCFLW